MHHAAQFFRGQAVAAFVGQVNAEQLEEAIADPVEQCHQGVQYFLQHQQRQADGISHGFRAQGGEGFWGYFPKDQQDDRQPDGRDCDSGLAPQLDGQDGGNRGSENVDEVVADQDGPEQSIWAFKQGAGAFCAAVPFLGLMTKAITIEAEHSSFGAGKECRAQQQTDQHADQKAGV